MPAGDLCTLSDLTAYLGDQPLGAASLTALSFIISAVSSWAQGYCERNLAGVQSYTWTGNGTGGRDLSLPEGPVVSVLSVSVDGVPIQPSSGSPNYGWVQTDHGVSLIGGCFKRGVQNVTVLYQAGWAYSFTPGSSGPAGDVIAGLPGDLRWAVIETVALRFKRRTSLGMNSQGMAGQNTSYDNSIAPKDALSTLQRYRKVTPW